MQLHERYGKKHKSWINRLYQGDNLQVMNELLKEFRGQVDLIYIDPPFDSKNDYKNGSRFILNIFAQIKGGLINSHDNLYNLSARYLTENAGLDGSVLNVLKNKLMR